MKTDQDRKLRDVLRTWEVSPQRSADFRAGVWQRIAAQDARPHSGIWAAVREWLFVQLPKPAYASILLVITAVVGVTAANLRAEHAREEYRVASARHYLASIDPIAMTAQATRASQ